MVYRSILVPVDGSKRAEAILPHVENLAQCYEAEVLFLHVVSPIPYVADLYAAQYEIWVEAIERTMEDAETYLAALEGSFREKGIKTRVEVIQGPVVETIIAVAERENSDLIAMASHGRTGLAHVFYGSVAAGVLHRIDRPLLIVRSA